MDRQVGSLPSEHRFPSLLQPDTRTPIPRGSHRYKNWGRSQQFTGQNSVPTASPHPRDRCHCGQIRAAAPPVPLRGAAEGRPDQWADPHSSGGPLAPPAPRPEGRTAQGRAAEMQEHGRPSLPSLASNGVPTMLVKQTVPICFWFNNRNANCLVFLKRCRVFIPQSWSQAVGHRQRSRHTDTHHLLLTRAHLSLLGAAVPTFPT